MYDYSFYQWLIFFYIYCFIGWCIESTFVSVKSRKFVNRGFLRSPMLPIYGCGAIAILFVSLPVEKSPVLVFLCGMTAATILEFITGWLMEHLLKMKCWDYSNERFNLKGYVCLQCSLCWGGLSLFLTYFLHSCVERLVLHMSDTAIIVVDCIVTVIFLTDLVYAIRTAINVNKLLAAITSIKSEIAELKEELSQRLEESEKVAALNARIEKLRADRINITEKIGFFKKDFIRANPTAKSRWFNEALEELRERIGKKS